MSTLSIYTDALTGSLSTEAIRRVQDVQPPQQRRVQEKVEPPIEDAVQVRLSDSAKEYAQASQYAEIAQEAEAVDTEIPASSNEQKPIPAAQNNLSQISNDISSFSQTVGSQLNLVA